MADDLIRYDVLVSDALRGVVRQVLTEVMTTGLPGDHHFYITLDTRLPGVRISSALRQRFPSEMTVVLQHQFWDLKVTDQSFEVGLSFSGVPERLLIPFSSITGFADPSVDFALKFETVIVDEDDMVGEPANADEGPSAPSELVSLPTSSSPPPSSANEAGQRDESSDEDDEDDDAKTADVVSLDAFRKKS
ncbi:MAG: ClpXP protease specificity-enhancing factor SspB [Pseudomonadota bacterium]